MQIVIFVNLKYFNNWLNYTFECIEMIDCMDKMGNYS